jgi:predicted pyridoxine 5'-phosphate oxidase superfamily flavin-nucleotide-binding protein
MEKRAIDIAFTPSVRSAQTRKGSFAMYEHHEFRHLIDGYLTRFLAKVRSFYMATVSEDGQPYVQHRGGPPGFLHVIEGNRLAFVDFVGNHQFITTGNLAVNPRAFIFLMDYANQLRIKIWGSAKVVEDDERLEASLATAG